MVYNSESGQDASTSRAHLSYTTLNTQLDTLIQGYRLRARTEGKSENTIRIANTTLSTLNGFLETRKYSTDIIEIGINELREFVLHLQQVKAFEHPHYTEPQQTVLSGHSVNTFTLVPSAPFGDGL